MTERVIFQTEDDAKKVFAYLYDCEMDGSSIIYPFHYLDAIELCMSLEGVKPLLIEGASCMLPFPRYEQEDPNSGDPQVFVRCETAYANEKIHGIWINASHNVDIITRKINWMLSWSPCANRWECSDYMITEARNWHGAYDMKGIYSLAEISRMGNSVARNKLAYRAYRKHLQTQGIYDSPYEEFESLYCGEYNNPLEFIENNFRNMPTIKKIDIELIAEDWFDKHYWFVKENKYFIFRQTTNIPSASTRKHLRCVK